MKQPHFPGPALKRRHWLVLAGSALSACGGGGDLVAALPGTGGTGSPLFAQGSITGFGSVIVNGIKFDDTQASVVVDGVRVTSDVLRLGMVAGVQGARHATDATLGTATAIEVWSIAQGPVTRVGQNDFDVMGMTIQTDANTSLDGMATLAGLSVNQIVVVWGLQAGADAQQWIASRVAVLSDTVAKLVTSGLVKDAEDSLSINGWQVLGAAHAELPDEQLVRVQGTLAPGAVVADRRMTLTSAKLLGSGFEANPQGGTEIEGVVTRLPVAMHFMLGPINVDASGAALAGVLGTLAVGSRVEVQGDWSAGVLIATAIKVEGSHSRLVEIDARIDTFERVGHFVVRGQHCDATSAQFLNGSLADLKPGIRVKVTGYLVGDIVQVSTLKLV